MWSDESASIPTELTVVGEDRDDPLLLLLLGDDGRYYAYSLTDGETAPVEPDQRWHPISIPGDDSLYA